MEDSFWGLLILSFKHGVSNDDIWDACEVNLIYNKVGEDSSAAEDAFVGEGASTPLACCTSHDGDADSFAGDYAPPSV